MPQIAWRSQAQDDLGEMFRRGVRHIVDAYLQQAS